MWTYVLYFTKINLKGMNTKSTLAILFAALAVNCAIAQNGILTPKQDKNGKCGFVNNNGEWVIKPKYSGVRSFSEGLAQVVVDNKCGYINTKGEMAIPIIYYGGSDFIDGITGVQFGNGKWGYIDTKGNTIIQPVYDYLSAFSNDDMAWVQNNGKYGFINKKGELVIPCIYEGVTGFSEGLSGAGNGGLYGFINIKGETVIPFIYRVVYPFSSGLAKAMNKKGYYGYIDKKGKEIIPFTYPEDQMPTLDAFYANYLSMHTLSTPETSNQEGNEELGTINTSSVDTNIPKVTTINDKTFAVIIANENYRKESQVPFALNDGNIFASYCKNTLGLPEKNVHLVENATLNDIKYEANWLKEVISAFNGEAKVIFYYAGHGAPDESAKTAYLLPIDSYSNDITTGYKLDDLYSLLGKLPCRSITVMLDACFSGSKREGDMLASARGVKIKVKEGLPVGNMVVLSAAQGDETAYPYKENNHGMFTYFLLKKLQETQGNITLNELSSYITTQVRQQSIVVNGKSQTPTVVPSSQIGDKWKMWKL